MHLSEPEITAKDILALSDPDFSGENVCLVTGVASGIGRATALAAAFNRLKVVGLDVDREGGLETRQQAHRLGGEMLFLEVDLTVDEQLGFAVSEAAQLGTIKYLANIAGIQHVDPIVSFPMAAYDHMHRLMLRAPLYLSRLVMPHMKASRDGAGVVGNMCSIHGHICTLNKVAYHMVKFGLRGLTQSIAAEGEGRIRAFSVSTGFVNTALALKQIPDQARQRGMSEEQVVSEVMLGKSRVKQLMDPVDVANLFIFGFSRFSRHLVGGDLLFDGGVVLTY
jgi:3-hydroxybutyrate dehydrogenase